MRERVCVYPGSFNPFHAGHADIVQQALQVFDKVIILVAVNPAKKYDVSAEKRKEIIETFYKNTPAVTVQTTREAIANWCFLSKVEFIVKGIRNGNDLESEMTQKYYTTLINCCTNTVFFTPAEHWLNVSSTAVRELIRLGQWQALYNVYGIDVTRCDDDAIEALTLIQKAYQIE